MRVLERDPFHCVEIDAVVARQNASHPGARRHCIGADTDALARQVGRFERSSLGIVRDGVMLASAHHHHRHQNIGFAERLGLQIGDDRQLGEIISRLAHNRFEQIIGDFDVDEIEVDEIGLHRTALERSEIGIVAQHGIEGDFRRSRHGLFSYRSTSDG
jgi:hypothetical protein